MRASRAALMLGDPAKAADLIAQARAAVAGLQAEALERDLLGVEAEWAEAVGNIAEAHRILSVLAPYFREQGARQQSGQCLAAIARLDRIGGKLECARARMAELEEAARAEPSDVLRLLWLLGSAACAEPFGEASEAERKLDEAIAIARRAMAEEVGQLAGLLVSRGVLRRRAGSLAKARADFEEAQALVGGTAEVISRVRSACYLAVLPAGDTASGVDALTDVRARLPHYERMETTFLVWLATHERSWLEESKRLLDHLVAHEPEDRRAQMIQNVLLHREIEAAASAS